MSRMGEQGWMKPMLIAAGIYNLAYGAFMIALPLPFFNWVGMIAPNYPELWQCIGMIVGVYGVGYWLAAYHPMRHWPIVLVGWLGKVLGPFGTLKAVLEGRFTWEFFYVNVFNDFIWWLPFTLILWAAWKNKHYRNV